MRPGSVARRARRVTTVCVGDWSRYSLGSARASEGHDLRLPGLAVLRHDQLGPARFYLLDRDCDESKAATVVNWSSRIHQDARPLSEVREYDISKRCETPPRWRRP